MAMANVPKAGRNDTCPCGSGKKYKKCHGAGEQNKRGNTLLLIIVGLLIAGGVVAGVNSFMNRDDAKPMGVWSPEHGHYH
jgi:hypothetical protein